MILRVVFTYKYIGHYTTGDLIDDEDINYRRRRTLFVQGNIILRKLNKYVFVGCEAHTPSYILFTYVGHIQQNTEGIINICLRLTKSGPVA